MPKPKQPNLQQQLLDQIAELSKQVAELKQNQQQQVQTVSKKREKGQPRPDVYYVLAGIPTKGLPPQAINCARILATAADTNHIPEAEAMALIEAGKAAGKLKTTQDAWHIFQYYRPQLISGDYLVMKTSV